MRAAVAASGWGSSRTLWVLTTMIWRNRSRLVDVAVWRAVAHYLRQESQNYMKKKTATVFEWKINTVESSRQDEWGEITLQTWLNSIEKSQRFLNIIGAHVSRKQHKPSDHVYVLYYFRFASHDPHTSSIRTSEYLTSRASFSPLRNHFSLDLNASDKLDVGLELSIMHCVYLM